MKVVTILGTRPEIIKLSSVIPILDKEFEHILIHTGQHYDYEMDMVFFKELHLRDPDYCLQVGSHSHGKQTGFMLEKIEKILIEQKPSLVIVQGDTNSTLAGALAAAKLLIPVAHIESGCRSFNKIMPEEINRIIVDSISDSLFAPDDLSIVNLKKEGISSEKIHLVGSTAFDASRRNSSFAPIDKILSHYGLVKDNFVLATIHRAESTNNPEIFSNIISVLNELSEDMAVVFPVHPRTTNILSQSSIKLNEKIILLKPQAYLNFLALLSSCRFCISDSGGIQEEALVFNKPCLIPRNETEWMRLIDAGKNFLAGTNKRSILDIAKRLMDDGELIRIRSLPSPLHENVSESIVNIIKEKYL
ncbi:MAG: UDP-N-acetylglucosamine 2-epimerase (non-hydrolyzing) [archaeon]|nr:UDP-N-acetylglucosamine 2-epimerase (non-hydrolyzing) [archaeon]